MQSTGARPADMDSQCFMTWSSAASASAQQRVTSSESVRVEPSLFTAKSRIFESSFTLARFQLHIST
jgi:hypothetical protein